MNCQRLRQRIENSRNDALNIDHFSDEMLAHINGCGDCKNLLAQRRELASSLHRIREALPDVPKSLDASVLTAFRRHMITTRREDNPLPKRTGRVAIYSSSAALLAAAAVVVLLALPGKKVAPNIQAIRVPQQVATFHSPISASGSDSQAQIKEVTARKRVIKKSSPPTPAISHDQSSFSSGFTSLMYCDRLSCAGEMEIVRVQLSPSMLGLPPVRADAARTVVADVLVGPDGIARGIRLEQ